MYIVLQFNKFSVKKACKSVLMHINDFLKHTNMHMQYACSNKQTQDHCFAILATSPAYTMCGDIQKHINY